MAPGERCPPVQTLPAQISAAGSCSCWSSCGQLQAAAQHRAGPAAEPRPGRDRGLRHDREQHRVPPRGARLAGHRHHRQGEHSRRDEQVWVRDKAVNETLLKITIYGESKSTRDPRTLRNFRYISLTVLIRNVGTVPAAAREEHCPVLH